MKEDEQFYAAFKEEIDILKKISSENIVKVDEGMESKTNYYIIQEQCE
jgi:serine/threonine protein kinase